MLIPLYLEALAITLVLEVPVYARELSRALNDSLARGSVRGAAVNVVSHPLGFLVIAPAVASAVGSTGSLVVVELFAWTGEGALLWIWLRRRPGTIGLISLLANSLSLLVGLALLR